MSTEIWRGDNDAVAQVDTNTIGGTIEVGDEFIITMNGKVFQYTAASTSADTERTALVTAFNLLTIPEFTEITAANAAATGAYTLTADTAGVPFTQTPTTTESGGGGADAQTHAKASTTANAGPAVWEADNFATGSIPGASDEVYLDNTSNPVKYGLDQSSAGTLSSLTIRAGFTAEVGLPEYNSDGTEYYEYRGTFFQINSTAINIGEGEGSGSGRLKIECDALASTVNVYSTGSSSESDVNSLVLTDLASSSVINLFDGTVDVDRFGGQTSTLTTLNMAGGTIRTGDGTTLTTMNVNGGTAEFNTAMATLTMDNTAAVTLMHASGTVTTVNLRAGTLSCRCGGTITTLLVGSGGFLDMSQSILALTITNCTLEAGATISDPNGLLTFSNAIDLGDTGLNDVSLELGRGVNILPS